MSINELTKAKTNVNVSPIYLAKVADVRAAPKGTVISTTPKTVWTKPIVPITLDPSKLLKAYMQMGSGLTVKDKVLAATDIITTTKTTTWVDMGVPNTTTQTYSDVVKENIEKSPEAVKEYFNSVATPVGAVTVPAIPDLLGGLGDLKNLLIIGGIAVIGIFAISQFSRR
jgi:hypothetical protein